MFVRYVIIRSNIARNNARVESSAAANKINNRKRRPKNVTIREINRKRRK